MNSTSSWYPSTQLLTDLRFIHRHIPTRPKGVKLYVLCSFIHSFSYLFIYILILLSSRTLPLSPALQELQALISHLTLLCPAAPLFPVPSSAHLLLILKQLPCTYTGPFPLAHCQIGPWSPAASVCLSGLLLYQSNISSLCLYTCLLVRALGFHSLWIFPLFNFHTRRSQHTWLSFVFASMFKGYVTIEHLPSNRCSICVSLFCLMQWLFFSSRPLLMCTRKSLWNIEQTKWSPSATSKHADLYRRQP